MTGRGKLMEWYRLTSRGTENLKLEAGVMPWTEMCVHDAVSWLRGGP